MLPFQDMQPQRGPKNVTINGHKYVIGMLPLSEQLTIKFVLLRNLGPGVAEAVLGLKHGAVNGVALGSISGLIRDLSLRVAPEDLTIVRHAFGKVCSRDGIQLTPEIQEGAFSGGVMELYLWLKEAVAHNYADFFTYATHAWSSFETIQSQKADLGLTPPTP